MDYESEYTKESLSGERIIYVSRDSRFGTDAVLLADFASPKRIDTAVDLCTGGGIIPLLWLCSGSPRAKVIGVEIQPECCRLARRSIEKHLPREKYSLVTCNPPYFVAGSGFKNKTEGRTIARSEVMCDSYDVCRAARYLLKYGGRLCICQRPERLTDVICAMREQGIEPKRIRLVQQRRDSEPWLVLVEGRRGGKPGLKFIPVLLVEDSGGGYSDEMREIYGRYGDKAKWQDN